MSVNVWNKSHMLESHHRTNWKQLASSFRLKKNSHTSRHFGDFRKVRSWLEPSIFEHFWLIQLSGSAPVFPASSASGSMHEKDRDEEISKASECQSAVIDSVSAPPDILLFYWTLVKDGVPPRGYECDPRDSHSEESTEQNWLSCGWQVLSQKADFPRDYLLPMPSGNLKGCLQRELRYDTAYALQRRVMDVLVSDGQKLFTHGVGHFWSPHSGRNFSPARRGTQCG